MKKFSELREEHLHFKIHGTAQTYDKATGKWDVIHKDFHGSGKTAKHALNGALKYMQREHPHHKEHEVAIMGSASDQGNAALRESWMPAQGHVYHSKTNKELHDLRKLHADNADKGDHQSKVHVDIANAILGWRATQPNRPDLKEANAPQFDVHESAWEMYKRKALNESALNVKTLSAEEIAQKHGVSLDTIKDQIAKGIKVEHEHATSDQTAEEIARDHLGERPDYYTVLDKANLEEADLKAQWNTDFTKDSYARRKNLRHTIKQQLNPKTPGLGNKAWKRADKEDKKNRPSVYSVHEQTEREAASHLDAGDAGDQADKQWEKDEEARGALKQTAGKKRRSLFNQLYRSQTAGRPGFSTMEESTSDSLAQFSHHWAQFKLHDNLSNTDRTHLTQRNHHERKMNKHYLNLTPQQKNNLRLKLDEANLEEAWGLGVRRTPSIQAQPTRNKKGCAGCGKKSSYDVNNGLNKFCRTCQQIDPDTLVSKSTGLYKESATTSTSGMSFKDAIAHATKHGGKIVFGTNSQKWHSISPQDRDYNMPHASNPQAAERAGEKQAKWGVRSVARAIVNRNSIHELHDEPDRPGTGIGVSGDGTEKGMAMTEDGPSTKKTITKAEWDHHTRHATAQFDTEGQRWIVQQDATGSATRIPVNVTEDYPYRQTIRRVLREAFPMAPKSTEKPDNTQDDEEKGEAPKAKKEKAIDPVVIGKSKDKFEADPILTPVLSVANMPGGSVR